MRDSSGHLEHPMQHRGSLRVHLIRSHMTIAGIGIVILIFAVIMSMVLRDVAMRLATESGPTAREVERVRAGLNQSLASLRGWMALGDVTMLSARRQAWEGDIRPGLAAIEETARLRDDVITQSALDSLTTILADLEQWQWHIEDVCQTPGNNPIQVMVEFRLDPVALDATAAVIALFEVNEQPELRATLWSIYHQLSSCELAFHRILADVGIDHTETLRQALDRLDDSHKLLPMESELNAGIETNLLLAIDDALRAYVAIGMEIIQFETSDSSNIGVMWLRDKALPCVTSAGKIIAGIRQHERDRMESDAQRVQSASNIVLIGGPLLLMILIMTTAFRARSSSRRIMKPIERLADASRSLAAGTLEKSIPRTTDDELGELTDCFNSMRISVHERENEVRRMAALESRNTSLEQFAHCASHDMKSPLVTIDGFCSVLRKRIAAGQFGELDKYFDHITNGVGRMRSTIDGLLDYCLAGHDSAETEMVQTFELVSGLLEDLAGDIHASRAEVELHPDLPTIRINRSRFEQVFRNLITNALKYGRTSDESARISISARITDDEIRFVVEDQGPGIDLQAQSKIFDLFQRLDSTSGTGVGLAIVKEVAEANGGRAWVDSEPGDGARFYVAFPKALGSSDIAISLPSPSAIPCHTT